jgi:hypothetical protein
LLILRSVRGGHFHLGGCGSPHDATVTGLPDRMRPIGFVRIDGLPAGE